MVTETLAKISDISLDQYLAMNDEGISGKAELETIQAMAAELKREGDWLHPEKLAKQIIDTWQIPINEDSISTTTKILNSRQGQIFTLGDCILPAAIFAAARKSEGLNVGMFCSSGESACHPYLIIQEQEVFWEVDFTQSKTNFALDRARKCSKAYIYDFFVNGKRKFNDLLFMLKELDKIKLECVIVDDDRLLFDEREKLLDDLKLL